MTREELESYRRRWAEFNRWEAVHPAPPRDFSKVLADLSWLNSFVSPEERRRDPDPEKLGIQRMRAMLAAIKTSHG